MPHGIVIASCFLPPKSNKRGQRSLALFCAKKEKVGGVIPAPLPRDLPFRAKQTCLQLSILYNGLTVVILQPCDGTLSSFRLRGAMLPVTSLSLFGPPEKHSWGGSCNPQICFVISHFFSHELKDRFRTTAEKRGAGGGAVKDGKRINSFLFGR